MKFKEFKWNYSKFKEFEKFILDFISKTNITDFIEDIICKFKEKSLKDILEIFMKMPEKEQLLILYLKSIKRKRKDYGIERDYLVFCENYYKNIDFYKQNFWKEQLIFNLGNKKKFLMKLTASKIIL
nr:hypothetical protein [uncultured Cetobacterium sp.]